MRVTVGLLCVVTIAAALWTLLLLTFLPFGVADGLYGNFRERLETQVGRQKANELIGPESVILYRLVQQLILMVGIPWAIATTAWGIFGIRMVRQNSAPPATTDCHVTR